MSKELQSVAVSRIELSSCPPADCYQEIVKHTILVAATFEHI